MLDPFQCCRFGDFTGFQKVIWRRIPSPYVTSQRDHDISTLIDAFEKLSIGGEPFPINSLRAPTLWGSYTPRPHSGSDVTSPYTIRTLQAPLPSLIRSPSRHKGLRPCPIFRTSYKNSTANVTEAFTDIQQVPLSGSISSSQGAGDYAGEPASTSVSPTEKRGRTKGKKKISGPPRRTPTNLPIPKAQSELCTSPSAKKANPSNSRSVSLHYDSSQLSLSSTSSSRSSSESHSPATPIIDFPDECRLPFTTSSSSEVTTNYLVSSKNIVDDIPSSIFPSTPSFLDQSPLLFPSEFSYNLSTAQLYGCQNFPPPISSESLIPTSGPFSFDL